jgi:arginine exporter protein ArgO
MNKSRHRFRQLLIILILIALVFGTIIVEYTTTVFPSCSLGYFRYVLILAVSASVGSLILNRINQLKYSWIIGGLAFLLWLSVEIYYSICNNQLYEKMFN